MILQSNNFQHIHKHTMKLQHRFQNTTPHRRASVGQHPCAPPVIICGHSFDCTTHSRLLSLRAYLWRAPCCSWDSWQWTPLSHQLQLCFMGLLSTGPVAFHDLLCSLSIAWLLKIKVKHHVKLYWPQISSLKGGFHSESSMLRISYWHFLNTSPPWFVDKACLPQ